MKPSLSVNDQVKMFQCGDTVYFIVSINIVNDRLVNICKIGDNYVLPDIRIDQLIMDKPYLLRKISAIHEIKSAKANFPEIALQSLEKSKTYNADCEILLATKLLEVNFAVIEWQSLIPTVSDTELNEYLKQSH
ncbi:MAG: hypothetical protein WCQ44_07650 [Opitutaceae bacterium]